MRLLPEKEKYIERLKTLVEKINEETKDLKPHCVTEVLVDNSREEKSQVLQFVFAVKNTESKGEKKYSVGMYLTESKKGLTVFIINGRTMKLLFENSTVNAAEIALHYLNDILLNEVKWVAKLEAKISRRKKPNKNGGFQKKTGNQKSYKQGGSYKSNDRSGGQNRNGGRDYKQNKNTSGNTKNDSSGKKKNYGNQGTGKQKTGGFKGGTGEGRLGYSAFSGVNSSLNIKTTRNPYRN